MGSLVGEAGEVFSGVVVDQVDGSLMHRLLPYWGSVIPLMHNAWQVEVRQRRH
jgi:hypothetical protein